MLVNRLFLGLFSIVRGMSGNRMAREILGLVSFDCEDMGVNRE